MITMSMPINSDNRASKSLINGKNLNAGMKQIDLEYQLARVYVHTGYKVTFV